MPPPPPAAAPGLPGAPVGASAPNVEATANGIPRTRYLQQTEQVRRMPIGIVLIVDQGHVQDVIRAFANSRLRFQNTQIHYERFRGVISLDEPTTGDVPPPFGGGGPPRPPRPEDIAREHRGRGDIGGAGRGIRNSGMPQGEHGGAPSGEDESSANLVELTVYGLISLYERFPPKAAAGQAPPAGAAQPAPGVPAGPGAPPPPPPPPVGAPVPAPAGPPGTLPPAAPLSGNPTATTPSKPPG